MTRRTTSYIWLNPKLNPKPYSDKAHDKLHLVMELCEGGDLLDFLLKTEITEDGKKIWKDPESKSDATFCFTERQVPPNQTNAIRIPNLN